MSRLTIAVTDKLYSLVAGISGDAVSTPTILARRGVAKCEPSDDEGDDAQRNDTPGVEFDGREHNDRAQDPGSIGCRDCGGAAQQPHRLEAGHPVHE